jgi:four helix bundle protein
VKIKVKCSVYKKRSGEQGVGSREQGVGSREQGVGSREWGAGSREWGAGSGKMEKSPTRSHEELEVYKMAFDAAMKIFELSKKFPIEERYSLTDQIRRSSRSVCANLAEAWRKRRYDAAFIAKLNDSEAEAAETQTWLKFAVKCNYLDVETARELYGTYNQVLSILVTILNNPSPWILKR